MMMMMMNANGTWNGVGSGSGSVNGVGSGGNAPAPALYVSGLPPTATSDWLSGLFSQFGALADVHAIADKTTGLCKGYGFVRFYYLDSARTAVQCLSGMPVYDTENMEVGPRYLAVSFKGRRGSFGESSSGLASHPQQQPQHLQQYPQQFRSPMQSFESDPF
eukprot:ANDGO_00192.mRNA.1 Protein elav